MYKVILDDCTTSVSISDPALYFPADRSGPAAVLRELLLHVRQPDVVTTWHDHGHEHGEHWARLFTSVYRSDDTRFFLAAACVFPENVSSDGFDVCVDLDDIHTALSKYSGSFCCDIKLFFFPQSAVIVDNVSCIAITNIKKQNKTILSIKCVWPCNWAFSFISNVYLNTKLYGLKIIFFTLQKLLN